MADEQSAKFGLMLEQLRSLQLGTLCVKRRRRSLMFAQGRVSWKEDILGVWGDVSRSGRTAELVAEFRAFVKRLDPNIFWYVWERDLPGDSFQNVVVVNLRTGLPTSISEVCKGRPLCLVSSPLGGLADEEQTKEFLSKLRTERSALHLDDLVICLMVTGCFESKAQQFACRLDPDVNSSFVHVFQAGDFEDASFAITRPVQLIGRNNILLRESEYVDFDMQWLREMCTGTLTPAQNPPFFDPPLHSQLATAEDVVYQQFVDVAGEGLLKCVVTECEVVASVKQWRYADCHRDEEWVVCDLSGLVFPQHAGPMQELQATLQIVLGANHPFRSNISVVTEFEDLDEVE
eukprot:GILK01008386.1.p1 GENE.GILK01008386.1~~GILK01008386.1.p1  ORF type:complete len:347 (-),score=43.86 GILK01008386.1:119-1159(-)